MSRIAELLQDVEIADGGSSESRLKGVRFFKATQPSPKKPVLYDPGICIVAQGHKVGYLGGRMFRCDANHYLVVSVTMPFECETFASPEEPLLALYIDVDMAQLHDLIGRLYDQAEFDKIDAKALARGIGPAAMEKDMADATYRLVKCLQTDTEAQILGPGLVREILYRTLAGAQAPGLYSLARHSGAFSQVAGALKIMQANYYTKLDVEHLANTARMSPSAFYRAFKEVTSDSPMQYLKKVRLNKAKNMIVNENMKAYIAAEKVGYESTSQFSREFKRYFGQCPAEMLREIRIAKGGAIEAIGTPGGRDRVVSADPAPGEKRGR
ncbi:MAG: AraC family transcriptional regulator [Pseudomonadota bacterium]